MKNLEAKFDAEKDAWLVRVPFGLSKKMMENVQSYLIRHWEGAIKTISPVLMADRHAFYSKGLAALRGGKIRQVIVSKGDVPLFQSTEKMTSTLYRV